MLKVCGESTQRKLASITVAHLGRAQELSADDHWRKPHSASIWQVRSLAFSPGPLFLRQEGGDALGAANLGDLRVRPVLLTGAQQ
jgi:hypothetical protein